MSYYWAKRSNCTTASTAFPEHNAVTHYVSGTEVKSRDTYSARCVGSGQRKPGVMPYITCRGTGGTRALLFLCEQQRWLCAV